MLHIQIIRVRKTKEKLFKPAEHEFNKRLKKYTKVTTHTVDNDSKILNQVKKGAFKVALEIKGKRYSSEEFAGEKLAFIIGGHFRLPFYRAFTIIEGKKYHY